MRLLAPAKVNLALHVTGRRDDGYHLLDSVVVFADHGDTITLAPSSDLSLTVTGPRAGGVPTDRRNLIWQAAELFPPGQGAAITLDKHLPHAGGIGGGSSDAATTLRGLAEFWGQPMPDAAAILSLGADVPVCAFGAPARMAGIGEEITPLPDLPPLWIVLVNPGVEVPTGSVFKALARADNPPLPELPSEGWPDAVALVDWLCRTRNDLEPPARAIQPEIGRVIDRLNARPGCLLARMSGSGATCFALFAAEFPARDAAAAIAADQPDWWSVAAPVLGVR